MGTLLHIGEALALLALIASVLFGWILVRFDYEMRWYMLSDRAIRIREGITTIREKTIALANIQNIEVKQSPLQRYLGLADVEVAGTCGYLDGPAASSQFCAPRDPHALTRSR